MIKNKSRLTQKDIIQFQRNVNFKINWFMLIMCIVIIGCGIAQILVQDVGFGIFCIVFGVIFYPLNIFISAMFSKKYVKSMFAQGEIVNTYEFDDNGITICSINNDKVAGSAKLSFNQIQKAQERKDAFYLFIDKRQSFIVLKNGFTEGSSMDLTLLLTTHLQNRFYIKSPKAKVTKTMKLAK